MPNFSIMPSFKTKVNVGNRHLILILAKAPVWVWSPPSLSCTSQGQAFPTQSTLLSEFIVVNLNDQAWKKTNLAFCTMHLMVDPDPFVDNRYPPSSPLSASKLLLCPFFHLAEIKMIFWKLEIVYRSSVCGTVEHNCAAWKLQQRHINSARTKSPELSEDQKNITMS